MHQPETGSPSCQDEKDPGALSYAAAQEIIRRQSPPLPASETLPLRSALRRVLAQAVIAPVNVPAHRNSAMDGYALAGRELAGQGEPVLRVIGTAWAGKPFAGAVGAGECVRIMTGAKIPEGADSVVIQERAQVLDETLVRILPGNSPGQNIRAAGEDIREGQTVLEPGRRIGPAQIGLLASLGIAELRVKRRVRVAFFSTGDELCSLGQPLAEGQIYDSNRHTLYGMLAEQGTEILDLGVIPDDRGAITQVLREGAAAADVVISTGGASVGEADYIAEASAQLGEILFSSVALKPGRPLTFGRIADALFFALPGNPVAVMVTFYQFVRPALRLLGGEADSFTPRFPLVCGSRLRKAANRTEVQRGVLKPDPSGELRVYSTGHQGSGVLSSMSEGDCFIILDESDGPVDSGDLVAVQPFELLR